MEAHISWRHMEHSPELETRVRNKLSKIERFSERVSSIEIIFTKESSRFLCEIQVKLEKAPNFVIKNEGYDLTEVLDDCLDKTKRKIKEYESKVRERRSGRGAHSDESE